MLWWNIEPSDRSRAARREIVGDLDKDLKSVPRLAGYDDKLKSMSFYYY